MTAELILIDLTVPTQRAVSRHEIADPELEHQLKIGWGKHRTTTIASCNCGAVLGEERPTAEPMARFKLAYEIHMLGVR